MIFPDQKTKIWHQNNRSDVLGSLRGSFNIDLQTRLGKIRTTGMITNSTTAEVASLTGAPIGFRYFNNKIWTAATASVYSNSGIISGNFSLDGTTGSPTDCDSALSDIEVFQGELYITGAKLNRLKTSGNWNSSDGFPLTIGGGWVPHMMTVYGNRLYVTTLSSKIYSMDSSYALSTSGQYTLSFSNSNANNITFIRSASGYIWIGVVNTDKGKGYIYQWDGAASQPLKSYRLESSGALACVVKDDVPYVMDSNGHLLVWNSGTFLELDRLPIDNKFLKSPLSATNNRFIHPNGMTIHNSRINMLINNEVYDNAKSTMEFCPSGIWEYDKDTGLYHKRSLSYTPIGTTTITDWGQNRISVAGGLAEMKIDDNGATANGTLLAGAEVFTTNTVTTDGIYYDDSIDTKQKVGYIVTPELDGDENSVADIWQKLFLNYRKLLNSGDKITVKYRISKQEPTEMVITWTSTTTFTTTDANMANYAVGDEVEIMRGKGGGMCSHITVISNNAGTYTVTVDETHTGATSGTAKARFQKWIKLFNVTDQTSSFKGQAIGQNVNNNWIQFKIVFYWTGTNEFEAINVVHKTYQPAA